MRRLGRGVAGVALGITLAACAPKTYSLVEPRPRPIDTFYSVEPGVAWTATSTGKIESWTIDGYALESLRFFKGIADGEPMVTGGANEEQRPRFRATMTLTESAELVATSLFGARVTPTDVRPAAFGGAPGFRFDVAYATRDGVERKALAAGAVVNDRLHVIVYDGTSLHHFGKYRAEAERVIESVRFK